MTQISLTEGSLKNILCGIQVNFPILQVLAIKKLDGMNNRMQRHGHFRFLVSDGKYSFGTCVLGAQLNNIADTIQPNAIISVDRYKCCSIGDTKKVLIILDLSILRSGEEQCGIIGYPISYETLMRATSSNDPTSFIQGSASSDLRISFKQEPVVSTEVAISSDLARAETSMTHEVYPLSTEVAISSDLARAETSTTHEVYPISSLTRNHNKWPICVRALNKSSRKLYDNPGSQGHYFSLDLIDASGEIRAVAFNEDCDKFYDLVQSDKAYFISYAILKLDDKEHSSLQNDYEMIFHRDTKVLLCQDDSHVPTTMRYHFIKFDELKHLETGTVVDVIGVCRRVDDVEYTNTVDGRRESRRKVQLVDDTGEEVSLTLWGVHARNFNGTDNSVVAFKGAKISEYLGRKNLTTQSSSSFKINPDIEERKQLRVWYYYNIGSNM